MITKLLDRWWDWQTAAARRRAANRPIHLPGDLSIPVDAYPPCRCTHTADVHRHYRDGNDCSQCPCRTYNARRITHA